MAETVPSISKGGQAAEMKGSAGGGLATKKAETRPVSLSLDLKGEVLKIVKKYSTNGSYLTPEEFAKFLLEDQKTIPATKIEGEITPEKLEAYLLSPENAAVQFPETDFSRPLKDYLISSSHNTYLVGHQLYGDASIEGYKTVLTRGCRCIEIDCWDGDNGEPKVVHGFTAVDPITFRVVCKAIAKYAFVTTDLPLIISLEVHCSIEQQKKMVEILHEEFGDMLLKDKVEGVDLNTLPSPLLLKNKILLKSKYLPPDEQLAALTKKESDPSMSSSESDQEEGHPKRPKIKILRSLSDLGVYTTSTHYHNFTHPLSQLFNHIHSFSERVFKKLHSENAAALLAHNEKYLTRVYPFGLRFGSSNQEPSVFWRTGAQLVALNWQRFDLGMQQNEALFGGSGGMVLKPGYIHGGNAPEVTLSIQVIGASNMPCPEDCKDISKLNPYLKLDLRSPTNKHKRETKKRRDTGPNVIWNETLTFPRVKDNLAFVRFKLYHDKAGKDHVFGLYTARLDCLQSGYRFLRFLDVEGKEIPGMVVMVYIKKM